MKANELTCLSHLEKARFQGLNNAYHNIKKLLQETFGLDDINIHAGKTL